MSALNAFHHLCCHTEKKNKGTWCPMLLSKEEADYFKVDTYDPIGLISKQINDFI